MNALFAKMHISLNTPMIWVAQVNRAQSGCTIQGDYLHTIESLPGYSEKMTFEQADRLLRGAGYIPVKDKFNSDNLQDINEIKKFASKEWRELWDECQEKGL